MDDGAGRRLDNEGFATQCSGRWEIVYRCHVTLGLLKLVQLAIMAGRPPGSEATSSSVAAAFAAAFVRLVTFWPCTHRRESDTRSQPSLRNF